MKTLVTGATGFLGTAVARALLARGHALRVTCRAGADTRNIDDLDVEIARADLLDHPSLRDAVSGCEQVFHVAADYRIWAPDAHVVYATNVDGTRALMQACVDAGVRRVVYTSSVATLGVHADRSPANEDSPVSLQDMVGTYKRSKFLAEECVQEFHQRQGLDVVIVNPSAPIGARDIKPTPTGQTILDAMRGRMPAYVDTGLNIVHVDDVAEGHLAAMAQGQAGRRYILGGEDMSLQAILAEVARQVGRRPPRIRLPHNLVLPVAYVSEAWARLTGGSTQITVDGIRLAKKHMYFSSARARRELDYQPRPAVQAIAAAVQWFRDFPPHR